MSEVTKVDMVFGSIKWLPKMEEIPEEFKRHDGTIWNRLFNRLFAGVLRAEDLQFGIKDGVTQEQASEQWSKFCATMTSFAPKHEHKEAGCAYLLSQVFDSWWTRDEKENHVEEVQAK